MNYIRLTLLLLLLANLPTLFRLGAEEIPGPFPREISAWTEEIKTVQRVEGQKMLAFVKEALERGEKTILVPKGDYRFVREEGTKGAQIDLNLLRYDGVVIDFQGSTFWFETPDRGIELALGGNTVRNLFVDWDPLPFVQGLVTSIDSENGRFRVRLDPGYEAAQKSLPKGIRGGRAFFFDPETGKFVPGQWGCTIHFFWDRKSAEGEYIVGYNGFYDIPISSGGFKPDDRVVLLIRQGIGLHIWGGREGCAIENVTFYASPSLVFATAGGHSPTMRNCAILRRPGTNRLMSGNADGFNFSNTSKGPLMENCRVAGALGDDFVNVHGHLARVIWQESPTEFIVTRMNWRADFSEPVTLEFFDRKTMQSFGKRLATGKLLYQSWKVEKDKCLADLNERWRSGDAAGLIEGKTISVHRITLDAPLEARNDMIVACEDFSGAGAVIRNCHFEGSSAIGIRMQAPHSTIENNVIEWTGGPGITLYGQPGFWGEGPFVRNAKITGNTIRNTGLFSSKGVHRAGLVLDRMSPASSILIKGNAFINPGIAAILATGADGLVIEDNRISGYGNLPPENSRNGAEGAGFGIAISASKEVVLRNNTYETPGPYAIGEEYNLEEDQ